MTSTGILKENRRSKMAFKYGTAKSFDTLKKLVAYKLLAESCIKFPRVKCVSKRKLLK